MWLFETVRIAVSANLCSSFQGGVVIRTVLGVINVLGDSRLPSICFYSHVQWRSKQLGHRVWETEVFQRGPRRALPRYVNTLQLKFYPHHIPTLPPSLTPQTKKIEFLQIPKSTIQTCAHQPCGYTTSHMQPFHISVCFFVRLTNVFRCLSPSQERKSK